MADEPTKNNADKPVRPTPPKAQLVESGASIFGVSAKARPREKE